MKNCVYFFLFVFLFSGCTSVSVKHEGSLKPDTVEKNTTYGWLEDSNPSDDIRINNPTVQKAVRDSVNKHLLAMGYREVAPSEADYLIAWFGSITDEVKEVSLSRFYSTNGYGTLAGSMPEDSHNGKALKTYSRGTLIIDVLDRKGSKVLWRGSATNILREGVKSGTPPQYVDKYVSKIFKGLPRK